MEDITVPSTHIIHDPSAPLFKIATCDCGNWQISMTLTSTNTYERLTAIAEQHAATHLRDYFQGLRARYRGRDDVYRPGLIR